jgi:hypothetical protein
MPRATRRRPQRRHDNIDSEQETMSGSRGRIAAKKPLTQPSSQRFQGPCAQQTPAADCACARPAEAAQQRGGECGADARRSERVNWLRLRGELKQLGGMEAYQSASKRGEKHLNSAQWIARVLQEHTTAGAATRWHLVG